MQQLAKPASIEQHAGYGPVAACPATGDLRSGLSADPGARVRYQLKTEKETEAFFLREHSGTFRCGGITAHVKDGWSHAATAPEIKIGNH
jgi:hypothetical protein